MRNARMTIWVMLVVSILLAFNSGMQAVTMEWVTVGNAGNAHDDNGKGSVLYEYKIGKYEVTAGQYTEFLNAVAATDTYGLYPYGMSAFPNGCQIQRHGIEGSFTYTVAPDYFNRPANYVNFLNASRFTNWLHNGQPNGLQTDSTTEDGAYDMEDGSYTRKMNACVFIPTENEWYKAAYYKGGNNDAGYWDYPNQSNSLPSNDITNPDHGNNANFWQNGYTLGEPYLTTEVGEFENSVSAYGTFDQGGNVNEWTETWNNSYSGDIRVRGGNFGNAAVYLHTDYYMTGGITFESAQYGFRVAAVIPEPSTLLLLSLGSLSFARRRIIL